MKKNFFNKLIPFKLVRNEDTTLSNDDFKKTYSFQDLVDYFSGTSLEYEPTLLNCLKYRSESLAKMQIELKQVTETGQNLMKENNLYNLICNRPNSNENAISFWAEVERERLLKGTSYVYIQRNTKGEVIALKRLKRDFITLPVIYDPIQFGTPLIYTYNSYKGPIKFSSEDLLIFKNTVISNNEIEGESSLTLLKTILETNLNGNKAIANINRNGIRSTVKVAVQDSIDEDNALNIVENAVGQARGSDSTGVIFQENGVEISPFDLKLNDADYLNIYKNNQCIILSFFGLSASMLNIEQSTGTYQNSESQMLQYVVNTLLFVMEQYIKELNYKLLTSEQIKSGQTFVFDLKGILKVDYQTLVTTQVELVNAAISTVDEARKNMGYNNLPNGSGSVSIVNGAYVSLDNLGVAYKDKVPVSKGGD
ncbi:MAG: phage portal protein [Sarcina sp.]